jgi:pseudouridine synthase
MRLNKFLADNTELSRRKADVAIENGRIAINGQRASLGTVINFDDKVTIDGKLIKSKEIKIITVLLNKPVGYVCSKDGQGSKTVYDLLPESYNSLNIAGRLDKDSSGLVVLTNDGKLLHELTHPASDKEKVYKVSIDKTLWPEDRNKLLTGVDIEDDRPSKFKRIKKLSDKSYEVVLTEGRNRQIRRTFEALGYKVTNLSREQLGRFRLGKIKEKEKVVL